MSVLVHVSDTHFGTEVPEVVEAARAAIRRIQPDVVVLSGDITQRARMAQFRAAKEFMDSLQVEAVLAVPGNHDIPLYNPFARFLTPYRNYEKTFGLRMQAWSNGEMAVACYDATHPLRHTRGEVKSEAFLQMLKQNLPEDGLLIACAHQPLLTAWPQDAHEVLINGEALSLRWARAGVDVALSGHVHVPLLTTTKKAFPALPRHFVLAGAGTAVSRRTRPGAPNSFNVLKLENGVLRVECNEYKDGGFICATATTFKKGLMGWE